ncbi:glycosyltransferase family 4 protein [Niallia taxi]|uniref:glycosyltransferase family 4 protein n=1 Tax=Niallia taxi TaxID=2499688 RepID=UPI003D290A8D
MEHVAHDLAKELVELGNKVIVVTTSINNNQQEIKSSFKNGYNLVFLPETQPMAYSKFWWRNIREYFLDYNRQSKVDLVISISAAANSIVGLKETKNIPVVFQAHGTALGEVKSKLQLNFKKKLSSIKNIYAYLKDLYYIPKYDAVITIGEKVYKEYLASKFSLNSNVKLINNAVDTKLFHASNELRSRTREKLNIPKDSFVFISTSRLNAQKGIKQAINIFKHVQVEIPELYFLIIGDGAEKENLSRQIKELEIESNVIMLGEVNREEINEYYSASDFMLFSTLRQEGLPLTILEALSNGLVCFISNDIKFDDEFPVLPIDPHNYILSAEKVRSTLMRDDLDNIKKEGTRVIENRFSMNRWGQQYLEVFNDLVKK